MTVDESLNRAVGKSSTSPVANALFKAVRNPADDNVSNNVGMVVCDAIDIVHIQLRGAVRSIVKRLKRGEV